MQMLRSTENFGKSVVSKAPLTNPEDSFAADHRQDNLPISDPQEETPLMHLWYESHIALQYF